MQVAGLDIASALYDFAVYEALPGAGLTQSDSGPGWQIVADLAPRDRELLTARQRLQSQIDSYHQNQPGCPVPAEYEQFLRQIDYLRPEPDDFVITTTGLDSELTEQCGPQLVVPVLNTCFAANAANARWGSLYDALYGSDVFPDTGEIARGAAYSPTRGARVIAYGRALLDAHFPLSGASHTAVERYCVHDGGLDAQVDGAVGALSDPRRSTSSLVIERATF